MKGAGKSTPNLPSSSRMQMPTGKGMGKMTKEVGEMKGSKGTTKKVMTAAKSKSSSKKGY
jgi:hypothetical protein